MFNRKPKSGLKYNFTAEFEDGSLYEQNAYDESVLFDKELKKSCFSDILELEKSKRLISFKLEGDGHKFVVSLMDGHFEIDGVPILLHEYSLPLKNYKLIYFRRHDEENEITMELDTDLKPFMKSSKVKTSFVQYVLGWEADLMTTNKKTQKEKHIVFIP